MVRSAADLPGGSDKTGWGGFIWCGGSQSRQLWVPRARKRSQWGQKYQCVRDDIENLFLKVGICCWMLLSRFPFHCTPEQKEFLDKGIGHAVISTKTDVQ